MKVFFRVMFDRRGSPQGGSETRCRHCLSFFAAHQTLFVALPYCGRCSNVDCFDICVLTRSMLPEIILFYLWLCFFGLVLFATCVFVEMNAFSARRTNTLGAIHTYVSVPTNRNLARRALELRDDLLTEHLATLRRVRRLVLDGSLVRTQILLPMYDM